jgi:hypothetical protein
MNLVNDFMHIYLTVSKCLVTIFYQLPFLNRTVISSDASNFEVHIRAELVLLVVGK